VVGKLDCYHDEVQAVFRSTTLTRSGRACAQGLPAARHLAQRRRAHAVAHERPVDPVDGPAGLRHGCRMATAPSSNGRQILERTAKATEWGTSCAQNNNLVHGVTSAV